MNENERTAVNQLKNIREVSAVKLKKIDKGSPDAKPLVYISNIKRADILLRMINELEAYRTIGTVEACKLSLEICKDMIERGIELDHIREYRDHIVHGISVCECGQSVNGRWRSRSGSCPSHFGFGRIYFKFHESVHFHDTSD